MQSRHLNETEASDYISSRGRRISVPTLRSWRWRRVGPKYLKIGHFIAYRESDLDSFLDGCVVEPEAAE
jgi:hypothetical protein